MRYFHSHICTWMWSVSMCFFLTFAKLFWTINIIDFDSILRDDLMVKVYTMWAQMVSPADLWFVSQLGFVLNAINLLFVTVFHNYVIKYKLKNPQSKWKELSCNSWMYNPPSKLFTHESVFTLQYFVHVPYDIMLSSNPQRKHYMDY